VGSKFHFDILLAEGKDPEAEVTLPSKDLAGKRVLVVDDNQTHLRILGETLERWGMRTVLAPGGKAALELAAQAREASEPFALVLTDAAMPDMDGFRLIEALRGQQHREATIMMLTAGGRDGESSRANKMAVANCLTKPISLEDLQMAVLRALSEAPEPVAPAVIAATNTLTANPLKILLAEDNPVNQKLAKRMLEKRGHSVEIARNGVQALSRIQQDTFDLVLSDIQMPEMDGFEMVAAIREREKHTGGHIPVIAMTALAMKGDRERCLQMGMDDYVSKPMQADELFEKIEKYAPVMSEGA
jgi:CheY-like chemotaxis protein